jgi:hypothetical protein
MPYIRIDKESVVVNYDGPIQAVVGSIFFNRNPTFKQQDAGWTQTLLGCEIAVKCKPTIANL